MYNTSFQASSQGLAGAPKDTKPQFASKACAGAPLSARGGVGAHKQGDAVLNPADRLAFINSCKNDVARTTSLLSL